MLLQKCPSCGYNVAAAEDAEQKKAADKAATTAQAAKTVAVTTADGQTVEVAATALQVAAEHQAVDHQGDPEHTEVA